MTTAQVFDIAELFEKTFGTRPYKVPEVSQTEKEVNNYRVNGSKAEQEFTAKGSLILEQFNGVEIWLPVRFFDNKELLMYLPYSVVRISTKKTIIRTPLVERRGTVKEQYSIDDYLISIKGFIIGDNREFPEQGLTQLRDLYEKQSAVEIDNALTNIFLTSATLKREEQRSVVITDLEIPEVQGGRKHVRPFNMQLESDTVFTLEYKD